MTEHKIQSAAIKEIRKIPGCEWAFAIPNARKCTPKQGRYLNAEGRLEGVWDIFVPCPNIFFAGIWIEFKDGKNELTAAQCLFGLSMHQGGYALAICRSAQEGIDAVIDYKKDHGKRRTDLAIMEIKELLEKR